MPTFADILPTLPAIDGIAALSLHNAAGEQVALLENKPGSAGSVRLYHALWLQHGGINHAAAQHRNAGRAAHAAPHAPWARSAASWSGIASTRSRIVRAMSSSARVSAAGEGLSARGS